MRCGSLCPHPQVMQQGGMFVFEGDKTLFSHADRATAAHTDLENVLGLALAGLSSDCGCTTP